MNDDLYFKLDNNIYKAGVVYTDCKKRERITLAFRVKHKRPEGITVRDHFIDTFLDKGKIIRLSITPDTLTTNVTEDEYDELFELLHDK